MSKKHLTDEELSAEWPYLTRRQVKEFKDAFAIFDKDGSGTISPDELRSAMRVIGEKLTDDEIEDAIKLADKSGDGEVDYDEFIQFVLSD